MELISFSGARDAIMFNYFYQLPDFDLFLLLSLVSVIVSITSIWLVRRYVPVKLRYEHNPVIGNISALISIIYGVLAGLMALYLINNNNYTSDAVQREANAIANIYRSNNLLREPVRSKINAQIKDYLTGTINTEWPAMQKGQPLGNRGDVIIDNIVNELFQYDIKTKSDEILFNHILDDVRNLYDSLHQRINMSQVSLNPAIWMVILLGTILTIGINYLFGMNFYLHLITVSACGLMFSSMIYLLITLDRPFQGEFTIKPTAFQLILNSMDSHLV
jgi:hypothetical protein